jgi:hypothetical protein
MGNEAIEEVLVNLDDSVKQALSMIPKNRIESYNKKLKLAKVKMRYDNEYKDITRFEKQNDGYENYVLFVNQLFKAGNEVNRDQFLAMLNKRYDNFDNYPIKFDDKYVSESTDNPLMNEVFSFRNIDLLMEAAPNIEEELLEKRTANERERYSQVVKKDPLLAFDYLMSSEKNIYKKARVLLESEVDSVIENGIDSNKLDMIDSFVKRKTISTQNMLNGISKRRKITPLGTLPAKKILENVQSNISAFNKIKKKVKIKDESTINFTVAKTFNELFGRLKKFKKKILTTAAIFSTLALTSAVQTMDSLTPMIFQEGARNSVVQEIEAVKFADYKIQEGDTLYSIAREDFKSKGLEFDVTKVANKVAQIVKDNPDLKTDINAISPNKNLKLR